jgi:DNA-directed RNA polymerase I subunit RPA49
VSTPGLKFKGNEPLKAYKKDKELLLASSSHPKLDFLAQEERSGASESLLKHYLGIYDPETGHVQVISAKQLVMRTRLHDARTLEDDVESMTHQSVSSGSPEHSQI